MGQQANMVMTSVSGHLLNYEFVTNFRNWNSCNPLALFDAPIIKGCIENMQNIKVLYKNIFINTLNVYVLIIVLDLWIISFRSNIDNYIVNHFTF